MKTNKSFPEKGIRKGVEPLPSINLRSISGVSLCCIGFISLCCGSLAMGVIGALFLAVGSSFLKQ